LGRDCQGIRLPTYGLRVAEKFTRIDDRLYRYLLAHEPPEHDELETLRLRTQMMPDGRMQITPEQGHFLALLVRLIAARRILEIGTFTGYSTLAMAQALPRGGSIVACDVNREWTAIAREHWRRAGVANKIDLRIAPATATLETFMNKARSDQFDLVFIDADKTGYDAYYEGALRLVRPGGLIILDNMLRRGRVADPHDNDDDTLALRRLNSKVAGDERVDRVLLPIASGMTLTRRR
jgi:O-methyltransferase